MHGARAAFGLLLACLPAPLAAETLDRRLDSPGSHAVVSVEIPLADIETVLNANLARTLSGQVGEVTDLLSDEKIEWEVQPDPLKLVAPDGVIHAEGRAKGKAKLSGKIGSGLLSTPFSQTLDLRGRYAFELQPQLNADWTVTPNLKGKVTLEQARLNVLGAEIQLEGVLQPLLDEALKKELAALAESFQDRALIREKAEDLWQDLCAARPLSDKAKAWLVIVPERAAAEQIAIAPETLHLSVVVSAASRLSASGAAPDCPPLPETLELLK